MAEGNSDAGSECNKKLADESMGSGGGNDDDGDDGHLTWPLVSASSSCSSSGRSASADSSPSSAAPIPSLGMACHVLESMRRQMREDSYFAGVGGADASSLREEQPQPPLPPQQQASPVQIQIWPSSGGPITRRSTLHGGHVWTMSSNSPSVGPLSYPSPTRTDFPPECLTIVRLMKGNQQCFDCGVNFASRQKRSGREGFGEALEFASVTYGTLLCRRCAFRHNTKSPEMSIIKSLDDGGWGLHEVVHLLEGGNGNMMEYVLEKQASRRRSSVIIQAERRGTFLGGPDIETSADYDRSFDERYLKSKPVAAYQKRLEKCVAMVLELTEKSGNTSKVKDIPNTSMPAARDRRGIEVPENNRSFTQIGNGKEKPRRPILLTHVRQPEASSPAPSFDRRQTKRSPPYSNGQGFNMNKSIPNSSFEPSGDFSAWDNSMATSSVENESCRESYSLSRGHHSDDLTTFLTVQEKIRRKRNQLRVGSCQRSIDS